MLGFFGATHGAQQSRELARDGREIGAPGGSGHPGLLLAHQPPSRCTELARAVEVRGRRVIVQQQDGGPTGEEFGT